MAKNRIHPRLAALSASAIAAIYAVGYIHTQGVDSALASAPPIAPTAPPVVALASPVALSPTLATPTGTAQIVVSPTAIPSPATRAATPTATTSTTAPTGAYKDGTFNGTGTSRFGNVELAVTVQGGKITGVELTKVATKYPASRIAALPGQVVARQSAQVDNVSGATASSTAFRTAVQAALAQAK